MQAHKVRLGREKKNGLVDEGIDCDVLPGTKLV